jgi:hypothetical protein
VFTEVWPPDYVPTWPTRWSSSERPRPLVVYLDQWCFADKLVRDRAGKLNDGDAGCYEYLRSRALDGSVIFPLSQAHYRENGKRNNADAMWDTAVVMAELSGFHTFSFAGLAEWDALTAVAAHAGSAVQIMAPEPIGWGMSHCLGGREAAAQVVNIQAGLDGMPEQGRQSAADVERDVAYMFELAMLARRTPPGLQVDLPLLPPIPDNQGAAFLELETKIRAALVSAGGSREKIRGALELLSYASSVKYLARGAVALGLDADVIGPGDDTTVLRDLVGAMPIQRIFTELRTQTHLKGNWKGITSDVLDFLPMATVVPFVDYYVADRKTYHLAKDAGLDQVGGGCRIVHRLSELCDLLRQRLS